MRAGTAAAAALMLALPALAHAAPCAEAASSKVTAPSSATVALAYTDLVVTLADRNAVGYGDTWNISLSLDNGTTNGFKPAQNACGLTAIYDWNIAANDFALFPGCPCPTWFWSWRNLTVNLKSEAPPDTIDRSGPVIARVREVNGAMEFRFDASKIPGLQAGRPWLVTVQSTELAPAAWASQPQRTYVPAWTFTGTLTLAVPEWIYLEWSAL